MKHRIQKPVGVNNVVRNAGGVTALAVTPRDELETYRTVVRLQPEVRDRTLAHTGPHSGTTLLTPTGESEQLTMQ